MVPVFGDTMRAIEREAKDANRNVSADLERSLEEGADRGSRKARDKIDKHLGDVGKDSGEKAGDNYAGAFESRFKRAIDGAEREMRRLNFKTASDESLRNLDKIKSKLAELKDIDLDVDFDGKKALAELAAVRAAIDALIDKREINVGFNMREAMRELEAMEKRIERFTNERRVIEPEVNLRQAERAMGTFEKSFRAHAKKAAESLGDSIDSEVREIRAKLASLGDTDIGIDLDATTAMAQMTALQARLEALAGTDLDVQVRTDAARAIAELDAFQIMANRIDGDTLRVRVDADTGRAVAQLTALQAMYSRLGGNMDNIHARGDTAANSFRAFNIVVLAAVTLLPALIPILAAVAGGLLALGPAAIGAGAGLGVMILGFSGVGNALTAMSAAEKSAERDTQALDKTMRGASRSVADASRALARARTSAGQRVEDAAASVADAEAAAARQIQDAQRAVADAHRQAAQAVQNALRQQEDAERSLADAQRDATQAQQDLREARRQAQEDLDEVADRQRQNALDIRQAQIDLFNATVANNAAQADPGATNLEREQASIDYGNAVERLKELRDTQKDLNEERKAGVNGNSGVQSAEDALAAALEQRADAARNLVDAERAVKQARLDGARSVADAERNLARARIDGAQSVADAEDALSRTQADGAQSVSDAQRNLRRAQQDYQTALQRTGEMGSTAMQNVQYAMDQLSPAGRRFVRLLWGMRDGFKDIRAAAQEEMLPGVQRSIEEVTGHFSGFEGFIRRMARTVGDLFESLANRLTSKTFAGFFSVFDRMGPKFLKNFGETTINWITIFAQLMEIAAPLGMALSDALLEMSENAVKFLASPEGHEWWTNFFDYVREVGPKVWKFFRTLWFAFLNIGEAVAPLGELIMGVVTAVLDFIANMNPTLLRVIVVAIIALVVAFQVMFGVIASLSAGLGLLAFILLNPVSGAIVAAVGIAILLVGAFIAAYTSSETFRDIVNGAISAVGDVIGWVWENVLQPAIQGFWDLVVLAFQGIRWVWDHVLHPILTAIGTVISWLWREEIRPALNAIWDIFDTVFHVIRWLWRNILWPVLDLIITVIWNLVRDEVEPALELMGDAWELLMDGMEWAWKHILRPLFTGISDALSWLRGRFSDAVDAIGRIWEGLQSLLAAPIRFVIDTVLNHGLIDAFNWVAGKVGSDKMGYIPLPDFAKKKAPKSTGNGLPAAGAVPGGAAHARGTASVLPGYTPGRDVHHFTSPTGGRLHLSGGEAIMVPEFTAAVGEDQINYWNSLFRRKGRNAIREAFYARGGVLGGSFAKGGVTKKRRIWPVPGHDTSTYPGHTGVDINRGTADLNDPIVAAAGGRVTRAGWNGGYGNSVYILTPEGVTTIYGHMIADPLVSAGQSVSAGTLIGRVGSTGNSTGPHLHFEVRPGGTTAAALAFLAGSSDFSGGDGGGFHLPGWLKAIGKPFEWLMDKLPLEKLDKYAAVGDLMVDTVQFLGHKVADKVGDMIRSVREAATSALKNPGAGNTGSTAAGYQDEVLHVLNLLGQPASLLDAVMQRMMQESGGNPTIVNNWDSNAAAGTPSVGLMQVIGPTFRAYAGPFANTGPFIHGVSVNPMANIYAGLNYALHRYGNIRGPMLQPGGYSEGGVIGNLTDNGTMMYDNGGYLPPGLTTVVNLTGKPEPVFTASQFDSMRGAGSGGGINVDIDVNGSNLTGADVAEEFLWAMRGVQNGGVYAGLVGER